MIKSILTQINELINSILGIFKSKRALLTTIMIVSWFIFGIKGIENGTDMGEFAAYFAALSPFVIGYIYGETKRPSGSPMENECCKK